MKVTVHRGGRQVGGTIIEVSSSSCRVFLDFGSNLPGSKADDLCQAEVAQLVGEADAIFYSHSHADHVGLFHLVPERVPQYIGAASKELLLHTYTILGRHMELDGPLEVLRRMRTYRVGTPIDVASKGEIVVTPYLVSHSAYDAYMLRVDVEGMKILYMGDFRRHGYLGKGLLPTLKKYIGEVDLLIIEGTLLGREGETPLHESVVKANVRDVLKRHKYVFALCSSTNADRLASFHEACREMGQLFLVDPYLKGVVEILAKYGGRYSGLYRFDRLFELFDYKAPRVQKLLKRQGFLMPIRASMLGRVKRMLELYNDEEPWLIYSMWQGYLDEGEVYSSAELADIVTLFGDRVLVSVRDGLHTSGHADTSTLSEVCRAVRPRCGIIPVHKDPETHLESIASLCDYTIFSEGEWRTAGMTISVS